MRRPKYRTDGVMKDATDFWFRLWRGDSLDVSIRLNTSQRWKAEVVVNGGSSDR